MDDGIDYLHPDLFNNFNADASFDFSSNDAYPYPRYTDDWFNSHGTRCAGEIAAARDGKGAVGVAYNSKIAGLRMLDQPYMTDIIEAQSMGYRQDLVDIYSASWGPTDDGKTCDGPRKLTMRAIVQGVNEGRRGKGSIYVWASGDGGPADDCNCDGYAASMWTISINSVTNDGETAGYDESCSSTLASTFSNGKAGYEDAGVATTDLFGNVTTKHSGTSAAAPEAAGVFALALEANPDLTWRDMQHIVVLTSKRNQLHDNTLKHPWQLNGAGLEFNHLFGYGVLDAGAMVDLAIDWQTVPERFHCEITTENINKEFDGNNPVLVEVSTSGCEGQDNQVNYLEHVQVFVTVNASRRGNIVMFLTSPMGTRSMILSKRPKDDDSLEGFTKWPFMTTHSWAEKPKGTWSLQVMLSADESQESGILRDFSLVLHGSATSPYLPQTGGQDNMKLQVAKSLHRKQEM
ncbi:neuroendocrine convertase 2-like [Watersipora subatra]|uniref:neuroendocrine convertase 2-like n=1 Tax=Watersipora subatra TaxID=2589382 RepID=UPI00355B8D00